MKIHSSILFDYIMIVKCYFLLYSSESGLLIHNIDPEGRVANSSMIAVNDVIIEINGRSLLRADFDR